MIVKGANGANTHQLANKKKSSYKHTREFCLAIKMNEVLTDAAILINLRNTVVNEGSQTQNTI